MTIIQAAALRVKWKLRVNPAPCEHLNLEAEWSENGPTGNYHFILCGEVVAKKKYNDPVQSDPLRAIEDQSATSYI
ncbi:MAG: hypothetical protein ABI684_07945 [Nitrospirota bacterium]